MLLKRERRKEHKLQAGIFPRTKGRPRIDGVPRDIVAEQIYKIQRMGIKNPLLQVFALGRKEVRVGVKYHIIYRRKLECPFVNHV